MSWKTYFVPASLLPNVELTMFPELNYLLSCSHVRPNNSHLSISRWQSTKAFQACSVLLLVTEEISNRLFADLRQKRSPKRSNIWIIKKRFDAVIIVNIVATLRKNLDYLRPLGPRLLIRFKQGNPWKKKEFSIGL